MLYAKIKHEAEPSALFFNKYRGEAELFIRSIKQNAECFNLII